MVSISAFRVEWPCSILRPRTLHQPTIFAERFAKKTAVWSTAGQRSAGAQNPCTRYLVLALMIIPQCQGSRWAPPTLSPGGDKS